MIWEEVKRAERMQVIIYGVRAGGDDLKFDVK